MLETRTAHWRIALLALAITAVAGGGFLPRLGELQLRREEPRRAMIARTMLEGEHPLLGSFEGRPYVAKPPGFPWMIVAATAATNGEVTALSARLPSVIALWVLALVLVATSGGVLGLEGRAALGFGCLLSYHLARKGTLAEIESPFVALVAISLWTWFAMDRSARVAPITKWIVGGTLAGLAFLTKREPGLVFFWLGVSGYLLVRGRARELISRPALAGGIASAAVSAVWPIAVVHAVGWSGWWRSLEVEILNRGAAASGWEIARHVAVYPWAMLAGVLPFGAVLPMLASPALRRVVRERHGEALSFATCVVAFNFPLYWLHGEVPTRYVMPLYPFVLAVAAMVVDSYVACPPAATTALRRITDRALRAIAPAMAVVGVALLVAIPVGTALDAPIPGVRGLPGVALAIAWLGMAAWIGKLATRAPTRALLPALIALGLAGRLAYLAIELPREIRHVARTANAERTLTALEEARGDATTLHALGSLPAVLDFYARGGLFTYPRTVRATTLPPPGERFVFDPGRVGDEVPADGWTEIARLRYRSTELVVGERQPIADPLTPPR